MLSIIFWLAAIAIAITIHEFAHAFIADKLGDPTARLMGRLSLNPMVHYDPVGTTLLIVSAIAFPFAFGWAKPVPFDPYNLDNPKRDSALIALAGPVSNILLAGVLSILLRFVFLENPLINALLVPLIIINIALAVFNLLPIHPLDGGKIIMGILPRDLANEFNQIMSQYGMFILILLIFPFGGQSALSLILNPIRLFFINLFLP